MKLIYPDISKAFDTEDEGINVIIIENQKLLFDLTTDLHEQCSGNDGKAVLSKDNKILPMSKNLELIMQFIPFDINKKTLVSKVSAEMERIAVEDRHEETLKLMSDIERHLFDISYNLYGDIDFPKLSIASVISASGLRLRSNEESLCEKIIDYMTLIREYEKEKLFVFVNLRSFVCNSEYSSLIDTIINRCFDVIFIENQEYDRVSAEKRYIIDADLCEIS